MENRTLDVFRTTEEEKSSAEGCSCAAGKACAAVQLRSVAFPSLIISQIICYIQLHL